MKNKNLHDSLLYNTHRISTKKTGKIWRKSSCYRSLYPLYQEQPKLKNIESMYADMYLMAPDIWCRTPNKNCPPHREGIKSASSNFQLYRCWFALSTQQQSSASVFLPLFYKLRLRTVTTSQSSDCKSNAHETHRATPKTEKCRPRPLKGRSGSLPRTEQATTEHSLRR